MMAVRLPKEMDERLTALTKKTGRTKSHYARQAIAAWLDEYEDYLIALSRLEKDKERVSLEQLERELGLED